MRQVKYNIDMKAIYVKDDYLKIWKTDCKLISQTYHMQITNFSTIYFSDGVHGFNSTDGFILGEFDMRSIGKFVA